MVNANMPSNDFRQSKMSAGVSVVVPTYRRGPVLLDTIKYLLALEPPPLEILVVDQTEAHPPEVAGELERLQNVGRLRCLRLASPSIPRAMNTGLQEARGEVVLFFDDDVVPQKDVVAVHRQVYAAHPEAWAVAGQVIQPEDAAGTRLIRPVRSGSFLEQDLDFHFGGDSPAWVSNVIACHLSVKRAAALAAGGFDENFIPPVSFRFETEFAKRLIAAGGKIRFESRASVRHLRAGGGGTRAQGRHLASMSPIHGVGAYYYILRRGRGWNRAWHMIKRPFREVCTRFHLAHPWFIPVKFIGELRALALALRLHRQGPRLLKAQP